MIVWLVFMTFVYNIITINFDNKLTVRAKTAIWDCESALNHNKQKIGLKGLIHYFAGVFAGEVITLLGRTLCETRNHF